MLLLVTSTAVQQANAALIPGGAVGKLTDLWLGVTTRFRSVFGLELSDSAMTRLASRHPTRLRFDAQKKRMALLKLSPDTEKYNKLLDQLRQRYQHLDTKEIFVGAFDLFPNIVVPAIDRYTQRINRLEEAVKKNTETLQNFERGTSEFSFAEKYLKTVPSELEELLAEREKAIKAFEDARRGGAKIPAQGKVEAEVLRYINEKNEQFNKQDKRAKAISEAILENRKFVNLDEIKGLHFGDIRNGIKDFYHKWGEKVDGLEDKSDELSRASSYHSTSDSFRKLDEA
ncbi:hypothetical protein ACQY0O_003868 [Thecaphora frezii]